MTEIRCKKCNRLLMKTQEGPIKGQCIIETKCPKCGYYNEINVHKFYGKVKFDDENFGAMGIGPPGHAVS